MPMPQLASFNCVACGRVINDKREGRFCERCGNPVHQDCLDPYRDDIPESQCPDCGGDPHTAVARDVRRERKSRPTRNGYPIGRSCPECGDKEYTKRAPNALIAFTSDRVCNTCGTRYTPP